MVSGLQQKSQKAFSFSGCTTLEAIEDGITMDVVCRFDVVSFDMFGGVEVRKIA